MLFLLGAAQAQTPVATHDTTPQIKKLYDAGQWEAVVRAVPLSEESADRLLYRGLALAHLDHLHRAEQTLQAGHARHPRDARFLEELAGIAYRQKHFPRAAADLRRALALSPQDAYASNFLGSIYYLEGNLEAALKYWNRVGKPKLSDLTFEPVPKIDPLILDRVFQFSPNNVWTVDRFLNTQATLAALDLFPNTFYDLQSQHDGSFRLVFHAAEPSGWTGTNVQSVITSLRWLPYQAVDPEFYNLDHKDLDWLSFVRWDAQKRMITSEVAMPVYENPARRVRLYFDGRNEDWDITNTLVPLAPAPAGLNFERAVLGAEFMSIASWRWQWNLSTEYSYRDFRTLVGIPAQAGTFFTRTSGLSLRSEVQHSLIRFPERRFTLDSSASGEAGKFFTSPLGRYGRVQGSLLANWYPQATGDDYGVQTRLRAGHTFGQIPFDDLYMLGFDRDNPLWMRGHNGLIHGKKGNAPLGSNFVLSNSEIDKIVYHDGIVLLKLGPFVDTGDIHDPTAYFGSPIWLTDTGLQSTIQVLGSFVVVLGYGKDLRSGANTFYSTISK